MSHYQPKNKFYLAGFLTSIALYAVLPVLYETNTLNETVYYVFALIMGGAIILILRTQVKLTSSHMELTHLFKRTNIAYNEIEGIAEIALSRRYYRSVELSIRTKTNNHSINDIRSYNLEKLYEDIEQHSHKKIVRTQIPTKMNIKNRVLVAVMVLLLVLIVRQIFSLNTSYSILVFMLGIMFFLALRFKGKLSPYQK